MRTGGAGSRPVGWCWVVEAVEELDGAVRGDLRAVDERADRDEGVGEEFRCLFEVDWYFTMGL